MLKSKPLPYENSFFELHQDRLLWLLNAPIIRIWFRYCMRINGKRSSIKGKIMKIAPNYIKQGRVDGDKIRYTTEFRTHRKFAKRMYYAFRPLWWTMHALDWLLLDRFKPLYGYSFGFDTLTEYPSAGAVSPCDGYVSRASVDESWSSIRTGAGNDNQVSQGDYGIRAEVNTSTTTNQWSIMRRNIINYTTSSLGLDTIDSATLGLYGDIASNNNFTESIASVLVGATPSGTADIINGDYGQLGSTEFATGRLTFASHSSSAYNTFTLNSSGESGINKSGVSSFGVVTNFDFDDAEPTWESSTNSRILYTGADKAGTSEDPKLTVEHTAVASGNTKLTNNYYYQ